MPRAPKQVLDDPPRQRVGGRDEFERFLQIGIVVWIEPFAHFDQKIDDLRLLHPERWGHFRARRDERIEIDRRRREVDAEIARGVAYGIALYQLAADEVIDSDRLRLRRAADRLLVDDAHDSPLT